MVFELRIEGVGGERGREVSSSGRVISSRGIGVAMLRDVLKFANSTKHARVLCENGCVGKYNNAEQECIFMLVCKLLLSQSTSNFQVTQQSITCCRKPFDIKVHSKKLQNIKFLQIKIIKYFQKLCI